MLQRSRGPARRSRVARLTTGARRGAVVLACAGVALLPRPALPAPGPPAGAGAGDDGWVSPFWAEPLGRPARQARVWEERGREDDAEALRRLAGRPTAVWMPGDGDDPRERVARVVEDAERAGRIPVLVAYNVPHRDCGQYSSGGARDATAYRAWLARAAEGIGVHRAWVVLEPDAVAHWVSGCLPAEAARERPALLAEAVRTFKARPGVSVYLDAGNPGWIADQGALAEALRRAGVAEADGFALNVSNFHTTAGTLAYGDRLSDRLGGAHYVIDTSRNGNGPYVPPSRDPGKPPGDEAWCNPPGRALGTPPTTATGDPRVDAFLWVKRPGESDGACRGAPPAGQWWGEYALGLATAAPPAGESAARPPAESTAVPAPQPAPGAAPVPAPTGTPRL
ncbi:hypothetical protein GCM10010218_45430 [Streptomyces mashuensis]|uniref:Glucanase n=1 Tax=Streptomyces mashuensis TaxID=33904 RepID=A0A919B778_9ACTN|nr:glycoside hydrolase family 6 protein [Streptomyces mashuensis]GHF58958.1 hypothetical protein GCM10010218_45430 [Streptomyces mashuensis]